MNWLTPFRWLHNRLHAEKRHYPHVTVKLRNWVRQPPGDFLGRDRGV